MNNDNIYKLVNSLKFKELCEYYDKPTMLDIYGIARSELQHTNFLAWLFDITRSHNLKDFCLKRLISLCYDNYKDSEFFPESLKNDKIINDDFNIDYCKIFVDKPMKEFLDCNVDERPDIFIKTSYVIDNQKKKLNIIIENKIDSFENDNQTNKYYETYMNSNYKCEDCLMIYLTPNNAIPACSAFLSISYQQVYDNILDLCLDIVNNEYIKTIINDYICCLSRPTELFSDKKKLLESNSVLAVTKREIKLINSVLDDLVDAFKCDDELLEKEILDNKKAFEGIYNLLKDMDYKYNNIVEKIFSVIKIKKIYIWKYKGKKMTKTLIIENVIKDNLLDEDFINKILKYPSFDKVNLVLENKDDIEYGWRAENNNGHACYKYILDKYYLRSHIIDCYMEQFVKDFKLANEIKRKYN